MKPLNICEVSEYGTHDQVDVNMNICELERRFQLALIDFLRNNNFPDQELLTKRRSYIFVYFPHGKNIQSRVDFLSWFKEYLYAK